MVHIVVAEPYTGILESLVPLIEQYEHVLVWVFNRSIVNLLTSAFWPILYILTFWTWLIFLFTFKLCLHSASLLQLLPFASIFAKNSESNFDYTFLHWTHPLTIQWQSWRTLDSGCPGLFSFFQPFSPSPNLANPHDHSIYVSELQTKI